MWQISVNTLTSVKIFQNPSVEPHNNGQRVAERDQSSAQEFRTIQLDHTYKQSNKPQGRFVVSGGRST